MWSTLRARSWFGGRVCSTCCPQSQQWVSVAKTAACARRHGRPLRLGVVAMLSPAAFSAHGGWDQSGGSRSGHPFRCRGLRDAERLSHSACWLCAGIPGLRIDVSDIGDPKTLVPGGGDCCSAMLGFTDRRLGQGWTLGLDVCNGDRLTEPCSGYAEWLMERHLYAHLSTVDDFPLGFDVPHVLNPCGESRLAHWRDCSSIVGGCGG